MKGNKQNKKVTKIFIAELIPSLNKGEAAILEGILESLKILGNIEVSICSYYPEIDALRYREKVQKIIPITEPSKRSLLLFVFFYFIHKIFGVYGTKIIKTFCYFTIEKEILNEYIASDLIIVGHDSVGVSLSTLIPKFLGKPVVVYSGSLGPFSGNRLSRVLMRLILNNVDLITLREEISYKYLQELGGIETPMYVTADPAFLLKPAPIEKIEKIMAKENIIKGGLIIGMTISQRMAYYSPFDSKNFTEKYDKFIEFMASVVDYLTDSLNATVVFLPHVVGPGAPQCFGRPDCDNDDRIVAEDIYKMAKNKDKVKVIYTEYTPEELKGLISQFDLVTGERMHSIIASTSMCVPGIVIPCPSVTRVYGIIGKMMEQEKYMLDVEKLDYETYISKIKDILSNKEEVKKGLKSRVEEVKKRALINGELVKDVLDSLNTI